MELIVLGSGTSTGVPQIACNCSVCTSTNERNKRSRSSIYISYNDIDIIIDTGIDFRQQILREKIQNLDLVLLTHGHIDHIGGLDDIRPFNYVHKKKITFLASKHAFESVKKKFDYCFKDPKNYLGGSLPQLEIDIIEKNVLYNDIKIIPIPCRHGNVMINAYRIDNFAYITDCNFIPDPSYELLKGLDVLFINAVKIGSHPSHFGLYEAIDEAVKINAKRTYLTHLSHDIEYEAISKELPENIFLAYDGLKISC